MTTTTLHPVPADGRILARYAPGLTKVLPDLREDLRLTVKHGLRPALHLGSASYCLGLLAQDAHAVCATYHDGPHGDHEHRMIHATEHLARLATGIRATADTVPQTTDTVRLVLAEIDQALAWLGTDAPA